METDSLPTDTDILILGANGPKTKHIFSADTIKDIPLLIVSDPTAILFTETERLSAVPVLAEAYGGCVRILAESEES